MKAILQSKEWRCPIANEDIKDQDNIVKITISKEAASCLGELVVEVNSDFEAGRVHRQDLASWILLKFCRKKTESDLHEIRCQHFNESQMLEAMYRRMKETGEIPEFMRDALRKQFQAVPASPKKSRKALTKEYINDVHREDGEPA